MLHALVCPLHALPGCAPHCLCAPRRLCALCALSPGPLLKSFSAGECWRDQSWAAGTSSGRAWPRFSGHPLRAGLAWPARKPVSSVCLQGPRRRRGAPWPPNASNGLSLFHELIVSADVSSSLPPKEHVFLVHWPIKPHPAALQMSFSVCHSRCCVHQPILLFSCHQEECGQILYLFYAPLLP